MDPATLLKFITNSTWMVTQLLGEEVVQFEKDFQKLKINESEVVKGSLIRLKAKVLLEDEPLEYYLKDKEDSSPFEVDSSTGNLFLLKTLNYEEKSEYNLTVGARVGDFVGETNVKIIVEDVNEYRPVFTRQTYETQITEEDDRHLPKTILKVSATDHDGGRWGEVRYILSGEGSVTEKGSSFTSIKNRRGIKIKKEKAFSAENAVTDSPSRNELNYRPIFFNSQSLFSEKDFLPSLTQRGKGKRISSTRFKRSKHQTIKSYRDNKYEPMLSDYAHYKVKKRRVRRAFKGNKWERKHFPLHEKKRFKRDDDAISSSTSFPNQFDSGRREFFAVHQSSGDILLLKPLDRDPPMGKSQWRLKVTATDGQWNDTSDIIINVKDVNDNSPYFPKLIQNAKVKENSPKNTFVIRVSAVDNDDILEARNAKVFYSLDKNVVDDISGKAIFEVDAETGKIFTHLCCLDREKTPSYSLQVVATDGGGLKGTGTVSIEVLDENDVSPKFSRDNWVLKVMEESPLNEPIGTISVFDPDVTNSFIFRINSEEEKKLFTIEGKKDGSGGEIYSKINLDYENPDHRKGFTFQVEVTDAGENGWSSKNHTAFSWVTLALMNKNDNIPQFSKSVQNVTLSEDLPINSSIASFYATDEDEGDSSLIFYNISTESNPGSPFKITQFGDIVLSKALDREQTEFFNLSILATDNGEPRNTATALLKVRIIDVNDNPPNLASSKQVLVLENSPPHVIGDIKLDDPDDWTLGHGPPFTLLMDPDASLDVKKKFTVSFNKGLGIGTIKSLVSLDREYSSIIPIPLLVSDSGFPPQTTTLTIEAIVADVNDNPMEAAQKHITVYALQPLRSNVPLGRVFVRDPDDWDASEKTYFWSQPHPLFLLNTSSGELEMKPDARPGRYNLGFRVNDAKHNQIGVSANVSVEVKSLTHGDLKTTNPLVIKMEPFKLLYSHFGKPSILDLVTNTVQKWLLEAISSDSGLTDLQTTKVEAISIQMIKEAKEIRSRLWIHTPHYVALQNFLLIQKGKQLEKIIGAQILNIGSSGCEEEESCKGRGCWSKVEIQNKFSLIDANETSLVGPQLKLITGCGCQPSSVKDANNNTIMNNKDIVSGNAKNAIIQPSSIYKSNISQVKPKTDTLITNSEHRGHLLPSHEDQHECVYNPCLNGGKCLPTSYGFRCICPFNTFGSRCKILSREFEGSPVMKNIEDEGGGNSMDSDYNRKYQKRKTTLINKVSWAWLPPVPTCAKFHISFELLTSQENALLMYTGSHLPLDGVSDARSGSFKRHNYRENFGQKQFLPFNLRRSRTRKHFLRKVIDNTNDNLFLADKNISFKSKNSFKSSNVSVYYVPSNTVFVKNGWNYHRKVKINNYSKRGLYESRRNRDVDIFDFANDDMLMVELFNGRPNLFLNLGEGLMNINLNESYPLNDNQWHRIDITWNKKYAMMFVDLCANEQRKEKFLLEFEQNKVKKNSTIKTSSAVTSTPSSNHSPSYSTFSSPSQLFENDRSCKGFVRIPGKSRQLNIRGAPLQLAGVSKSLENTFASGLFQPPFKGCIKNLRINKELKDLGHSLLSQRSTPYCKQDSCSDVSFHCRLNGRCKKESGKEVCKCNLGWKGRSCEIQTVPVFFEAQSFVTVALSFTPLSTSTSVELRIRTRSISGEIVRLSSPLGLDNLSLFLTEGHLCFNLKRSEKVDDSQVCLNEVNVSDGKWHSVQARRVSSTLMLELDDGDGSYHNSSLSLAGQSAFDVSPHDGCHIGGYPEYKDGKVVNVQHDFNEGCIEDLRLDGYPLPLPPFSNVTDWGQVTYMQNVRKGCRGRPVCSRFSCSPPLKCFDTWNSYYCGCGEGKRISDDGSLCKDINECQWNPCLNGGSCHNSSPGFLCVCDSGFEGRHCEIATGKRFPYPSTLGVVAGIVSFCFFLLIVICVIILAKRYYSTYNQKDFNSGKGEETEGYESSEEGKETPQIRSIENSNKSNITRVSSCRFPSRDHFSYCKESHFGGSVLTLDSEQDQKDCILGEGLKAMSSTRKCKSVTFLADAETKEALILQAKKFPSPLPFKCSSDLNPTFRNCKHHRNQGKRDRKLSFPIMNPIIKDN